METVVERVIRIHQEEEGHPKPALARADIPARWASITTEWLTAVLCAKVPGARVIAFNFGPRDDGTSNRRRIHVEYNDIGRHRDLPATVFCKASMGLENRIALGVMGCIHAETTFYGKARPLLDLEAPVAHLAAYDPLSFAAIAVFDDLGSKVDFCDEDTYYDRGMAEGQVDIFSTLHAKFQADPRLGGPDLPFAHWTDWFKNLLTVVEMETYCTKGFLAAEQVIPPRLYRRVNEVWPATIRAVERHHALTPTLLHGDAHAKNWYCCKEDQRMGLGDWQAVCVGHWARDYAYGMASSLEVDDRRAWERDLLLRYIEGMKRGGADAPTFDEAWTHYRQQLFAGLAYWTITLTPAPNMPAMQPEKTTLTIIKRLTHAIDDLDALDSFR